MGSLIAHHQAPIYCRVDETNSDCRRVRMLKIFREPEKNLANLSRLFDFGKTYITDRNGVAKGFNRLKIKMIMCFPGSARMALTEGRARAGPTGG